MKLKAEPEALEGMKLVITVRVSNARGTINSTLGPRNFEDRQRQLPITHYQVTTSARTRGAHETRSYQHQNNGCSQSSCG